jgi:hypothetical protein
VISPENSEKSLFCRRTYGLVIRLKMQRKQWKRKNEKMEQGEREREREMK